MSYKLIGIEELMQLNRPQLRTALRVFQQELDGTIKLLTEEQGARKDEDTLDELSNLLTLRKVFKLRLAELDDLAAQQPQLTALEQYQQNELQPAA